MGKGGNDTSIVLDGEEDFQKRNETKGEGGVTAGGVYDTNGEGGQLEMIPSG